MEGQLLWKTRNKKWGKVHVSASNGQVSIFSKHPGFGGQIIETSVISKGSRVSGPFMRNIEGKTFFVFSLETEGKTFKFADDMKGVIKGWVDDLTRVASSSASMTSEPSSLDQTTRKSHHSHSKSLDVFTSLETTEKRKSTKSKDRDSRDRSKRSSVRGILSSKTGIKFGTHKNASSVGESEEDKEITETFSSSPKPPTRVRSLSTSSPKIIGRRTSSEPNNGNTSNDDCVTPESNQKRGSSPFSRKPRRRGSVSLSSKEKPVVTNKLILEKHPMQKSNLPEKLMNLDYPKCSKFSFTSVPPLPEQFLVQNSLSSQDTTVKSPESVRDGKPTPRFEDENEEARNKREQKRLHIVSEILSTERTFVESLEWAISHYLKPLTESADLSSVKDSVLKVFGNIELLLSFNKKLLDEIEKIVQDWKPSSSIGPVFIRMGPFLKMYTTYSNRYAQSIQTYNSLRNSNETFTFYVDLQYRKGQRVSNNQLKLEDYLIMPIQRIPRYALLLRDLLNVTLSTHDDYKYLKESLAKIEEVGYHINEEVRKSENQLRVEEMQQKGVELAAFIKPHRHLIKEGLVKVDVVGRHSRADGKHSKDIHQFLLFNDLFVHIKKDLLKHGITHCCLDLVIFESNLTNPPYTTQLVMLWITRPTHKTKNIVCLTTPLEILTFTDIDGWAIALEDSISSSVTRINQDRPPEDALSAEVRESTYTYSTGSATQLEHAYHGYWSGGNRHGRGRMTRLGNVYFGYWENDKMSGRGQLTYGNGAVYLGEWKNDLPNGKGELKYPDGTRFIGAWEDGMRHGPCNIKYSNGNTFSGTFEKDRISGKGRLTCFDGLRYEGEWSRGSFHGIGKLRYSTGIEFEGSFDRGVKSGRGRLRFPDGAVFIGDFVNNLRQGGGTMIYADSSKYVGSWVSDLPEGEGRKEFTDGVIYEGNWMAGLRHGQGKCLFADGSFYEGNWDHDKRHGEGTYTDSVGSDYKGQWVRDSPEGRGQWSYKNGSHYKGTLLGGQYHKRGVWTLAESSSDSMVRCYDGEWLCGYFHGKGILTLTCGDSFKGNFANNLFHGEGTYTWKSGESLTCKWSQGVPDGKANAVTAMAGGGKGVSLSGQVNGYFMLMQSGYFLSSPVFPVPPLIPDVDSVKAVNK